MRLFLPGFLLSLSLCLDLGVVNVALINTGLRSGVRPAFLLGLGSCVGDLIYALLALTAISIVLQASIVREVLWIAGTTVLAFLAVRMIRHSVRPKDFVAAERRPQGSDARGAFLRGVGLALASPSAILWFAAAGGSTIASYADDRAGVVPFLTGFFTAGLLWSAILALITGRGRTILGPRAVRTVLIVSAGLFVYLAASVGVRGYREFVMGSG